MDIQGFIQDVLGIGIRYHRVKYNETLASISDHYYGSPDFAMVIYQHNRHFIADPNAIYPGQRIAIPHIPKGSVVL